jgi:hypothetical protein
MGVFLEMLRAGPEREMARQTDFKQGKHEFDGHYLSSCVQEAILLPKSTNSRAEVHFLAACSILICHAFTELRTVLEGREKPQGLRELTCAFRGKLARNAA